MLTQFSRFAIKYGLIPYASYLIRAYFSLIRIRTFNDEMVFDHLRSGWKMIAAIWHQRIFIILGYAKRYSAHKPSVMISQSRDGEMAPQFSTCQGIKVPGRQGGPCCNGKGSDKPSVCSPCPRWTTRPESDCEAGLNRDGAIIGGPDIPVLRFR
jgi:hypothetical protein